VRYSDFTETIGQTPMLDLRRLNPNPAVRIFAKLEGFNPKGSLKDCVVKYMVESAEAFGELTPIRFFLSLPMAMLKFHSGCLPRSRDINYAL